MSSLRAYDVTRKSSDSSHQEVIRAMSALVSTLGSSTIGNCMDQRHRLRRIA
jgi:hypothetical protein